MEPVPDRHRESQFPALGGHLRQQPAHGFAERELGRSRGGLLRPGKLAGHREHLAVEERRPQFEPVRHGGAIRLDQDVAG